MMRTLLILIVGLVTSFFLFPFNLPVGITVNTKMIVAVLGAVLFVWDKMKEGGPVVSRRFLIYILICATISVWSYCVTVVSGTSDYVFVKYIVSVIVWLGAAYAVVWLIKAVHGRVTVELVGNYLIGVCTVQCLLAYLMTVFPGLEAFVDSLMGEGESFMGTADGRMHGLGAALDPAGLRFSAILLISSFLMAKLDYGQHPWQGVLYLMSFVIVSIIGNMIARTTTVGFVLSVVLYVVLIWPRGNNLVVNWSWGIVGGGILAAILVSVWLYNNVPTFRENIRFGFEGFFSLVEKGRWEVRSNDMLKGMIIWPESLKTWIIGDGYFDGPQDIPDRFGQIITGYYMKTDIGYLRYIFYFGSIGLVGMISAFVYLAVSCMKAHPEYRLLFLSFLIVNILGWLKVSSDIIMVFAPFFILACQAENQPAE